MTELSERDQEMVANVRASTEAALQALRLFQRSLAQSGMRDGAASYRAMCDTVYSQSVWMLDKDDPATVQNLEGLRATARSIIEILEPYMESFGKLTELPTLAEFTEAVEHLHEEDSAERSPADGELPAQERVLAYLGREGKRASASRIRASTGLRRKELEEALQVLVGQGRVVAHRASGRDLYELG